MIAVLVVISSMALLQACKKENVPTFDSTPSLYFLSTSHLSPHSVADSVMASFGYSADNVTDSIIKLPINVIGKTSPVDRVYKVIVVDSGTTAKAGYNYDLPKNTVIRAGLSTDSLAVTIHRTPDILYHPLSVTLQLESNENFTINMVNDTLDAISGKPNYFTIFKVVMEDGLTQPPHWNWGGGPLYYFGTFSVKKVKLTSQITGMPLGAVADDNDWALWPYWATMMNRYLLDQKAAGTPILEDDGTPMTMGRIVTR
ncbi:MAG TPA: DUF4843 domain-containing protein [Puia sp.]|nr:DUF4843 domain-containing protein [Puia sp.]